MTIAVNLCRPGNLCMHCLINERSSRVAVVSRIDLVNSVGKAKRQLTNWSVETRVIFIISFDLPFVFQPV